MDAFSTLEYRNIIFKVFQFCKRGIRLAGARMSLIFRYGITKLFLFVEKLMERRKIEKTFVTGIR